MSSTPKKKLAESSPQPTPRQRQNVKKFLLRLPNSHYDVLLRDAQKMSVSVTSLVNFIINQYVAESQNEGLAMWRKKPETFKPNSDE